jgi:2-iminobutanoate/2-iminopropanoate deaminase
MNGRDRAGAAAADGGSNMNKQIVTTSGAPAAIGPYSQAVKTGLVVFLSGQIGLDPATQALAGEDFGAQVRQAFRNLAAVAQAAGGSLADAVKLTLFLTDLSKFSQVNDIMAELMPKPYPARSTIGVASLPRGAQFEVEAILVL